MKRGVGTAGIGTAGSKVEFLETEELLGAKRFTKLCA